jgi:hypothetical protein
MNRNKPFLRAIILLLISFSVIGCGQPTIQLPTADPAEVPAILLPTAIPTSSSTSNLSLAGNWEGKAEWPGLSFSISFSIAEGSDEVADLKTTLTCPGSAIPDGNFSFPPAKIINDTFSAFGTEGKFVSSTDAEGSFDAGLRITCGEETVPTAGAWTATKITK